MPVPGLSFQIIYILLIKELYFLNGLYDFWIIRRERKTPAFRPGI
jgi:hypothetical protein